MISKPLLIILVGILRSSCALKYPNEIIDTPVVVCDADSVVIKIKTTTSNPSRIYADDYEHDSECIVKNSNKLRIEHGKCGMRNETTDQPSGTVQRVCITVQLHPLFVTEADRSYCAQCVYVESRVMDDLKSSLEISEATPTELKVQFDEAALPKCSYTLRKDSEEGPEVRYATIGDKVFHVWSCEGEHNGLLVQNCHVEDGQGTKILIIDHNGCGIDHYVIATPIYDERQTKAFQETHVFKFAQRTITRFVCQIRICLKGDDCKRLSPPTSCPTLEQRLHEAEMSQSQDPTSMEKDVLKFEGGAFQIDENVFTNAMPPSSKPTDAIRADDVIRDEADDRLILSPPTQTTAQGIIYYGAGTRRERREVLIDDNYRHRERLTVRDGLPEVEMVGELRVFENPQDVDYFESRAGTKPNVAQCATAGLAFTLLVTALIVTSILLITLILFITSRINSAKNNSLHYAQ